MTINWPAQEKGADTPLSDLSVALRRFFADELWLHQRLDSFDGEFEQNFTQPGGVLNSENLRSLQASPLSDVPLKKLIGDKLPGDRHSPLPIEEAAVGGPAAEGQAPSNMVNTARNPAAANQTERARDGKPGDVVAGGTRQESHQKPRSSAMGSPSPITSQQRNTVSVDAVSSMLNHRRKAKMSVDHVAHKGMQNSQDGPAKVVGQKATREHGLGRITPTILGAESDASSRSPKLTQVAETPGYQKPSHDKSEREKHSVFRSDIAGLSAEQRQQDFGQSPQPKAVSGLEKKLLQQVDTVLSRPSPAVSPLRQPLPHKYDAGVSASATQSLSEQRSNKFNSRQGLGQGIGTSLRNKPGAEPPANIGALTPNPIASPSSAQPLGGLRGLAQRARQNEFSDDGAVSQTHPSSHPQLTQTGSERKPNQAAELNQLLRDEARRAGINVDKYRP